MRHGTRSGRGSSTPWLDDAGWFVSAVTDFPGAGLRQLAEELPGGRGLPDARRAAEPQDGDYAAWH